MIREDYQWLRERNFPRCLFTSFHHITVYCMYSSNPQKSNVVKTCKTLHKMTGKLKPFLNCGGIRFQKIGPQPCSIMLRSVPCPGTSGTSAPIHRWSFERSELLQLWSYDNLPLCAPIHHGSPWSAMVHWFHVHPKSWNLASSMFMLHPHKERKIMALDFPKFEDLGSVWLGHFKISHGYAKLSWWVAHSGWTTKIH